MKKRFWFILLIVLLISISNSAQSDSTHFSSFGKITIYKPVQAPNALVLFVSGDGGWMLGVVEMAKVLVREGALVAGIDIRRYYRNLKSRPGECYYPAADFEGLSLYLQKKYKFPQYLKPILCGYSSGATLVYGLLRQAPANTFKGAISLGFCPDIEVDRPLCKGSGLKWHVLKPGRSFYLEAEGALTAPFYILQGINDHVCSFQEAKNYMAGMQSGELIPLPKVGHGFAVEGNWVPQFKDSYRKVLAAPAYAELKRQENKVLHDENLEPMNTDVPVTLIPSAIHDTLPMAFMISGDGGWTSFDQSLAENLAGKGISVVGLDAQKYFWNEKTPTETTADISKVLAYYMQQWNKKSFILVGYSFGANIIPFIANRISFSQTGDLRGVFLLSPDITADFEIHVADMLSIGSSKEKYEVIPEVKKIKSAKVVCIFGEEEEKQIKDAYGSQKITMHLLPGSHHYNDDFARLAESIFTSIGKN